MHTSIYDLYILRTMKITQSLRFIRQYKEVRNPPEYKTSVYDYRYCVKEHILVITSRAILFDYEEIHYNLE